LQLDLTLGDAATSNDWYQMAIWLEDHQQHHLETLFVTGETGRQGLGNNYKSLLGFTIQEHRGSLPVWAFSRDIGVKENPYPTKQQPLPDAITGATIKQSTVQQLFSLSPEAQAQLRGDGLRCLVEINVSRDGVPSLVFDASITPDGISVGLKPLGMGDEKGRHGTIFSLDDNVEPSSYIRRGQVTLRP
jgi:hypothetical protein